MRFEWDERKRVLVKRRHGVDLADVHRAFEAPHVEIYDREHSEAEDRWRLVGVLDAKVVVVSYTYRGDAARLITVRWANAAEAGLYYQELFGRPEGRRE
jgi:uncharacterized DUF497 family protein